MSTPGQALLSAHAHGDTTMAPSTDTDITTKEPIHISTSEAKTKSRSKPKTKAASEARGKRSLNLSIPYEDYQRLAVHALDDGKTISDLVCELARTHLRRVHLTRTTRPADSQ
jgi:hypothetical protein